MIIDELIEKAFCDGYEYAQRVFGNKANKAAKKLWEKTEANKRGKSLSDFRWDNRAGKPMILGKKIGDKVKADGGNESLTKNEHGIWNGIWTTPREGKKDIHDVINANMYNSYFNTSTGRRVEHKSPKEVRNQVLQGYGVTWKEIKNK